MCAVVFTIITKANRAVTLFQGLNTFIASMTHFSTESTLQTTDPNLTGLTRLSLAFHIMESRKPTKKGLPLGIRTVSMLYAPSLSHQIRSQLAHRKQPRLDRQVPVLHGL